MPLFPLDDELEELGAQPLCQPSPLQLTGEPQGPSSDEELLPLDPLDDPDPDLPLFPLEELEEEPGPHDGGGPQ